MRIHDPHCAHSMREVRRPLAVSIAFAGGRAQDFDHEQRCRQRAPGRVRVLRRRVDGDVWLEPCGLANVHAARCAPGPAGVRGTRCTGSPAVVPRRPGGCSSASASPATRRAGSRSDCRRRATAPDRRQSTWTARAAATTSSFEQAWPYGQLGEGEHARGEHLPRVATTAAGGVTEVAHRSSRDCRGLPCLP